MPLYTIICMNRLLKECSLEDACAYLDGQHQTTHYKIIDECTSEQCHNLIERGWRRFGNMFFRPICKNCTACESVKIDVANYSFSKSARRVIRKNRHFRTLLQHPTITQAHLDLFKKYHDHMENKREWDHQTINVNNYYMSFVHGYNTFGYEVLYFDKEKLIAVDLIDILPEGISSIYFYYDPDYATYSLGRYSLYRQILYAQQEKLPWIYLGYYVEECQSLAYKKNFSPYLMLEARPGEEKKPVWSLPNDS